MRSAHPRFLLAAAAAAAALSGAPAVAGAATVSYAPDGALVLTAAPGEINHLGVQWSYDETKIVLYDGLTGVGSATPAGCTRDSETDQSGMTCPIPPAIRADLGDGDDQASISLGVKVPVTFLGGPGNDALQGNEYPQTIDGGPGNDVIQGSKGDDILVGGDGNDDIQGAAGSDRIDAGPGDDLVSGDGYEGQYTDVIDGGAGFDRIQTDFGDRSYSYLQPAVTVTLGGGADDGRPGENDDVRGIEKVAVNIPGTYTGTDADETFEVHQVLGTVNLDGRGGNDTLIGADGPDAIQGGPGADTIDAGFGDDVITPGPGRDAVSADRQGGDCGPLWCKYPYGNDTVNAVDGEVDSITCGAGQDRVLADAVDIVAPDCETVERSGAGGPGGGASGGAGVGAGAGVVLTAAVVPPAKALRRGLSVRLTGVAARQRVSLVARAGKRIVARGTARASSKGTVTVVLRFSKAGRRAVLGRRKVTLVVSGAGTPTTVVLRAARA